MSKAELLTKKLKRTIDQVGEDTINGAVLQFILYHINTITDNDKETLFIRNDKETKKPDIDSLVRNITVNNISSKLSHALTNLTTLLTIAYSVQVLLSNSNREYYVRIFDEGRKIISKASYEKYKQICEAKKENDYKSYTKVTINNFTLFSKSLLRIINSYIPKISTVLSKQLFSKGGSTSYSDAEIKPSIYHSGFIQKILDTLPQNFKDLSFNSSRVKKIMEKNWLDCRKQQNKVSLADYTYKQLKYFIKMSTKSFKSQKPDEFRAKFDDFIDNMIKCSVSSKKYKTLFKDGEFKKPKSSEISPDLVVAIQDILSFKEKDITSEDSTMFTDYISRLIYESKKRKINTILYLCMFSLNELGCNKYLCHVDTFSLCEIQHKEEKINGLKFIGKLEDNLSKLTSSDNIKISYLEFTSERLNDSITYIKKFRHGFSCDRLVNAVFATFSSEGESFRKTIPEKFEEYIFEEKHDQLTTKIILSLESAKRKAVKETDSDARQAKAVISNISYIPEIKIESLGEFRKEIKKFRKNASDLMDKNLVENLKKNGAFQTFSMLLLSIFKDKVETKKYREELEERYKKDKKDTDDLEKYQKNVNILSFACKNFKGSSKKKAKKVKKVEKEDTKEKKSRREDNEDESSFKSEKKEKKSRREDNEDESGSKSEKKEKKSRREDNEDGDEDEDEEGSNHDEDKDDDVESVSGSDSDSSQGSNKIRKSNSSQNSARSNASPSRSNASKNNSPTGTSSNGRKRVDELVVSSDSSEDEDKNESGDEDESGDESGKE